MLPVRTALQIRSAFPIQTVFTQRVFTLGSAWVLLCAMALVSPRAAAQDAEAQPDVDVPDVPEVSPAQAANPSALTPPLSPTPVAGPSARQLVVQAVGEYNAGRYEEAYALFRRAHELEPTARTLRSMGMVLFELRRYVDATQRLSQALVETRRPLTEAQSAQTRVLLDRARQFVARVIVHVVPEDAILTLDGAPVELIDGELDLDSGTYVLVAQCEGCQSQTARIRALAGEQREITLTLTELSATATDAPPALPQPIVRPSLTGPALLLATGVALAFAAVPTALIARQEEDKLSERCSRGICDGYLRATRDRANRFALLTDALWGTGAAIGLTGLIWLIVRKSAGSRPDVSVACSSEGCVSSLSGRF